MCFPNPPLNFLSKSRGERFPFLGGGVGNRKRARNLRASSCEGGGGAGPRGPAHLCYAVLLLEHGVLCVLPMLWAALLFSEAGWDLWAGWVGWAAGTEPEPPPPLLLPPAERQREAESGQLI